MDAPSQVAIVSGAAGGIGAATVRAPARQGARVAIVDLDGSGAQTGGSSKGALIALTRQLAVELAAQGVTANAVCPGPLDTPLTRVLHSDKFRSEYTRAIPMNRYGSSDEIAALLAFLAAQGAAYVTGVALPVDGGLLAAGASPD